MTKERLEDYTDALIKVEELIWRMAEDRSWGGIWCRKAQLTLADCREFLAENEEQADAHN